MTSARIAPNVLGPLCIAFCSVLLAPARVAAAGPTVTQQVKNDVSFPLRDMAAAAQVSNGAQQEQAPVALPTGALVTSAQPDPVAGPLTSALAGVRTGLNFDGQSAQDTRNLLGFAFVPPDTNGAAGATQFVQIVNVTIAVYDKGTGALVLGPALISGIWRGFGGPCENGDGGDPIVLYDQLAGRWLVSQFQFNSTFTSNQQCVAISTSSDATGSYNRYEFDFGDQFPDYPKFGVWPDAYYYSANIFVPFGGTFSFAGAQACAFERAAMLVGAPARAICFQNPTAASL